MASPSKKRRRSIRSEPSPEEDPRARREGDLGGARRACGRERPRREIEIHGRDASPGRRPEEASGHPRFLTGYRETRERPRSSRSTSSSQKRWPTMPLPTTTIPTTTIRSVKGPVPARAARGSRDPLPSPAHEAPGTQLAPPGRRPADFKIRAGGDRTIRCPRESAPAQYDPMRPARARRLDRGCSRSMQSPSARSAQSLAGDRCEPCGSRRAARGIVARGGPP